MVCRSCGERLRVIVRGLLGGVYTVERACPVCGPVMLHGIFESPVEASAVAAALRRRAAVVAAAYPGR